MAETATLTVRVADLTSTPRPGWVPEVRVGLERPAVALDGTVVSTEPVVMKPGPDGTATTRLIVSSEFTTRVRYTASIVWQSPSLGVLGGTMTEHLPSFTLPAAGGDLGELAPDDGSHLQVWEGSTPPPASMWWLYVAPDGLTPYRDPAGVLVSHGELVDWEA